MLPKHVQKILIQLLPNIELYHGKRIHDKVLDKKNHDFFSLIPKGQKCFIWFKEHRNREYIYIYHIDTRNKKITNVDIRQNTYHEFLTTGLTGTILYGSVVKQQNLEYIVCEDVLYYKSVSQKGISYKTKFNIINKTLEQINISINKKQNSVFCKPIISESYNELVQTSIMQKYDSYCIQCYKGQYYDIINHNKGRTDDNFKRIFTLKADLQDDIYHVYNRNDKIGLACIPDYKTSVFMNGLFRNIKENINLDSLEESDDEEEFENISFDKFVDLEKRIKMECKYHSKFKMWVPVKKI